MLRRTLVEIAEQGSLDAQGNLVLEGQGVISLVYYRAGYSPDHFSSETEWTALELIERSYSIKCPTLPYILAGFKRVQQALTVPGALNRFVSSQDAVELLKASMVGQWRLDREDEETTRVVADAISNYDNYVLKPQREGGGNNVWGREISEFLAGASVSERSAFVLMSVIRPEKGPAVFLRHSKINMTETGHPS